LDFFPFLFVWLLIVLTPIVFIEFGKQIGDIPALKFFFCNLLFLSAALVMISLSYYLIAWNRSLLGGEIYSFFIMLVLDLIVLFLFKKFLYSYFSIDLQKPNLMAAISSILPLIPGILY